MVEGVTSPSPELEPNPSIDYVATVLYSLSMVTTAQWSSQILQTVRVARRVRGRRNVLILARRKKVFLPQCGPKP